MPTEEVVVPPWLEGLPIDSRGFPVPAEAGWKDGEPLLSSYDSDRTVALIVNRACAVCGYRIPDGSLFYRAWGEEDAEHIRKFEREMSHDDAGPCHFSCIVYSAIVCPHLQSDRSRLMKTSQINPGAPRGKKAAIIGFQKTGILMPDPSILGRTPTLLPMAVFDGLKKDIRYRQGSELHYLLSKAIEKDAKVIDMSGPRLFWSGSAEDTAAMTTVAMEGMRALMQSKPPDYAIDVQRTAPGARNYGVYHACWM